MSCTCDLDVPRSIPIGIEYSQVAIDLTNAIAFHPMTPP